MIYEERNESGALVPCLSLALTCSLYLKLRTVTTASEIKPTNKIFKDAITLSGFLVSNDVLWGALNAVAMDKLPPPLAKHLLSWTHAAYSGYHAANPNIYWASILLKFTHGSAGWPDVGQTPRQQAQFDEFAEFFLRIWGRDALNHSLEVLKQSSIPSDWDREV